MIEVESDARNHRGLGRPFGRLWHKAVARFRVPVAERYLARCGSTECLIIVFCLALIAGIWLLTVERVQYERGEAIQDTVRRNSNLVLGLEEYVVRIMKSVDQTILLLKHRYERYGSRMQVSDVVPDGQLTDALIATFAVLDEHGYVLFGKAKSAPMQRGGSRILQSSPAAR